MATLDQVQPHQISPESSVVLESPKARMVSQYLCGTETLDLAHMTTLGMNGVAMQHGNDSQKKPRTTVQYLDYLTPEDKSDVLVMLMQEYN